MWSPTSAHLDLDVDGWSDRAIGRYMEREFGLLARRRWRKKSLSRKIKFPFSEWKWQEE